MQLLLPLLRQFIKFTDVAKLQQFFNQLVLVFQTKGAHYCKRFILPIVSYSRKQL